MPLRLILATWAAKLAGSLSRALGRGSGSALPGLVALRLSPDYVARLSQNFTHGVVVVTGTNGKTTTASLLAAIAREHGWRVVHNATGSNLTRGVAAALAAQADWSGRIRADLGIFEIDEATMPEAVKALQPRLLAVGNLFRDQLDRYGELDTTARLIRESIQGSKAAVLLNADDPLVAWIGRDLPEAKYFGLETAPSDPTEALHATDSRDCPVCGTELEFASSYYGHLGHWKCPAGDFTRPEPAYAADDVKPLGLKGSSLTLKFGPQELALTLPLPGLYSAYNALEAAGLATSLEIPSTTVKRALESYRSVFGRIETVEVDGREVVIVLVKNPAGFNQALSLLELEPGTKPLLLALNDRFADGTDVSWIWDSDFERINRLTHRLTASGIRASELSLRLKYAGVDPADVDQVTELGAALDQALSTLNSGERLYVLPTYTAMLELRRILRKRGHLEHLLEANS